MISKLPVQSVLYVLLGQAPSGSIADPWLRFFARFVDIQIEILVLSIVAGLLVPALFQSRLFLSGQLGSKLIG